MVLSISGVLLLFVFVVMFLRGGKLRPTHAVVCVLLGFCLAGTNVAPTIQSGVDSTANLVSGIRP